MLAALANKENPHFSDVSARCNAINTRRKVDRVEASIAAKDAAHIARTKARSYALRLPSHLARPSIESRTVRVEFVRAVAPELATTPLHYIRQKLAAEGKSMLMSISCTQGPSTSSSSPTTGFLPGDIELISHSTPSVAPTHVLALTPSMSTRSESTPFKFSVFPTHSLVLLSHCAALPHEPFTREGEMEEIPSVSPESDDSDSDSDSSSSSGSNSSSFFGESRTALKLPIIPLTLPSPSTFTVLHGYLYTKNLTGLLVTLLPLTPSQIHLFQHPQMLASHLSAHFTAPALAAMARKIHNLWMNATALGVDDDNLWNAIEMSWGVVCAALKQSTGASAQ